MRHPTVGVLAANLVAIGAEYVEAVATVQITTAVESRAVRMAFGVLHVGEIQNVVTAVADNIVLWLADKEETCGQIRLAVGLGNSASVAKLFDVLRDSDMALRTRENHRSFTGEARKRLDFMAALRVSAASSEKGSGVLEGVAMSRVARDEPCLAASAGSPPERRHQ